MIFTKSPKLNVIKQSADKQKINLQRKKNIMICRRNLNKVKGYDIFGSAIINILNDNKIGKSRSNW